MRVLKALLSATILAGGVGMIAPGLDVALAAPQVGGHRGCVLKDGEEPTVTKSSGGDRGSNMTTTYPCNDFYGGPVPIMPNIRAAPYIIGNFVTADQVNSALSQIETEYQTAIAGGGGGKEPTPKDGEQDGRLVTHDQTLSSLTGANNEQDVTLASLRAKDVEQDSKLGGLDGRFSSSDAKSAEQDGRLNTHDQTLSRVVGVNSAQDEALSALRAKDINHDSKLGGLVERISSGDTKNAEQDTRLSAQDTGIDALKSEGTTIGNRLGDVDKKNFEQDASLAGHAKEIGSLFTQNEQQDARLMGHDVHLSGLSAKDVEHDASLASHGKSIARIETKNAQQDGRLSGHDHDIAAINGVNEDQDDRLGKIEGTAVFYDRDSQGQSSGGLTLDDGSGAVIKVSNVAPGTRGTNAANIDQLQAAVGLFGAGASIVDGAVRAPSYAFGGQRHETVASALSAVNTLAVQYTPDAGGEATNLVRLIGDGLGSPVTVTNVADGISDRDATNYGQVKDRVSYGRNADGSRSNTISLQGGGHGPVALRNIAAGHAPGDAVNMGQFDELRFASNHAVQDVRNDMNAGFSSLNGQIRDVRQEARGGIAIALASTSIRYNDDPGRGSIGLGFANFKDSFGFASGVGYTSEDGLTRMNGALGYSPNTGDLAVSGGLSFTFH